MTRAAPLLLLTLWGSACDLGESKEQREAERVVADIQRLGTLPRAERGPHITELENQTVESPRVEKVRDHCAKAYRALHTAQTKLAKMKDQDVFTMAGELSKTTEALEQAKRSHEKCRELLVELKQELN